MNHLAIEPLHGQDFPVKSATVLDRRSASGLTQRTMNEEAVKLDNLTSPLGKNNSSSLVEE